MIDAGLDQVIRVSGRAVLDLRQVVHIHEERGEQPTILQRLEPCSAAPSVTTHSLEFPLSSLFHHRLLISFTNSAQVKPGGPRSLRD